MAPKTNERPTRLLEALEKKRHIRINIISPFFFFNFSNIFGLLRAYAKYHIRKNIINPIILNPPVNLTL